MALEAAAAWAAVAITMIIQLVAYGRLLQKIDDLSTLMKDHEGRLRDLEFGNSSQRNRRKGD